MSDPKAQNEEAHKYALEDPVEIVSNALGNVERLQEWTKKDLDRFPKAVALGKRLQGFEFEGQRYVCREDDFDSPKIVQQIAANMMASLIGEIFLLSGTWQPLAEFEKNPDAKPFIPIVDRHDRIWIPDENPFKWIIEALNEAVVSANGLTALTEVVPVAPETSRDDPIFPVIFGTMQDQQSSLQQSDLLSPWPFGPDHPGDRLAPPLPLVLYHLGIGSHQQLSPGSGAPLIQRIFVEMCLSVPLEERNRSGPVLFKAQRFYDFLKMLYPDPSSYRPSRHFGPIREALEILTTPEARIPWVDPTTGDGAARLVVIPLDVPRNGRKEDWIQFQVHLPPGSGRGVIMDRPALRIAGVRSGTMYRMALSLALWWHYPGLLRIPVSKGIWRQVRSPERYPEVTDDDLIAMAYPFANDEDYHRMRLKRARDALADLVRIGYAIVFPRRRILPGPKWAGWGRKAQHSPRLAESA